MRNFCADEWVHVSDSNRYNLIDYIIASAIHIISLFSCFVRLRIVRFVCYLFWIRRKKKKHVIQRKWQRTENIKRMNSWQTYAKCFQPAFMTSSTVYVRVPGPMRPISMSNKSIAVDTLWLICIHFAWMRPGGKEHFVRRYGAAPLESIRPNHRHAKRTIVSEEQFYCVAFVCSVDCSDSPRHTTSGHEITIV